MSEALVSEGLWEMIGPLLPSGSPTYGRERVGIVDSQVRRREAGRATGHDGARPGEPTGCLQHGVLEAVEAQGERALERGPADGRHLEQPEQVTHHLVRSVGPDVAARDVADGPRKVLLRRSTPG